MTLLLTVAMYYLVLAPALGDTVNLPRLSIGGTFCVVGAIFAGFARRPRA